MSMIPKHTELAKIEPKYSKEYQFMVAAGVTNPDDLKIFTKSVEQPEKPEQGRLNVWI